MNTNCDRPPAGWQCTRDRGHDGPCAASPVSADAVEGDGDLIVCPLHPDIQEDELDDDCPACHGGGLAPIDWEEGW